jgi:hypothetical protein
MTMPKPQANKFARFLHRSSAGAGRIYSRSQPTAQLRQQLKSTAVKNPAVASRISIHRRPRVVDLHSTASTAALKSP